MDNMGKRSFSDLYQAPAVIEVGEFSEDTLGLGLAHFEFNGFFD